LRGGENDGDKQSNRHKPGYPRPRSEELRKKRKGKTDANSFLQGRAAGEEKQAIE